MLGGVQPLSDFASWIANRPTLLLSILLPNDIGHLREGIGDWLGVGYNRAYNSDRRGVVCWLGAREAGDSAQCACNSVHDGADNKAVVERAGR